MKTAIKFNIVFNYQRLSLVSTCFWSCVCDVLMNNANSKLIQYIWKVMPAFKSISILTNTLEEMTGCSWWWNRRKWAVSKAYQREIAWSEHFQSPYSVGYANMSSVWSHFSCLTGLLWGEHLEMYSARARRNSVEPLMVCSLSHLLACIDKCGSIAIMGGHLAGLRNSNKYNNDGR